MKFHSKTPFQLSQLRSFCSVSHQRSPFGIAFDIDGVILRGRTPIGNSPAALRRLYDDSGVLKIPFLFLTNGGGIPESRRALELSELLCIPILPSQIVQGHSPFRGLLRRFENEFIVATGKGKPAAVMSEYGFKNVISLEEYASYFDNIDPVAQYKSWKIEHALKKPNSAESNTGFNVSSDKVKAAFIVSDPVDWGRDIQVLCDILTSGGLYGEENEFQPPLYFAADDLQYQAAFPSERLGMGAFRTALESVFNRSYRMCEEFLVLARGAAELEKSLPLTKIHHKPLEYTIFGKPNPFVFRNAEIILRHLRASLCPGEIIQEGGDMALHAFETLYMIGDNPPVDIKGARQAGQPWFSILTRTGVFRQVENHAEYPADLVVDTVEEAVEYIMRREGIP